MRMALWLAGIILVLVGGFFFGSTEARLNAKIEREIGTTLAEFRAQAGEASQELDAARVSEIRSRHIALSAVISGGVLCLLLGSLTRRRVVGATIGGLVFIVVATAVYVIVPRLKSQDGALPEGPSEELAVERSAVFAGSGLAFATLLTTFFISRKRRDPAQT